VAIQEGRYIADLIQCRLNDGTCSSFRYREHGNLATIGRHRAVADMRGVHFNGFFAWVAWAVVHLLYIIEFEDRMLVLVQWLWSYLTWNRSDLLITYTSPPGESRDAASSHVAPPEEVFKS